MAFYDTEIMLPNRNFLNFHLKSSLDVSRGSVHSVALLYIGFDKLKVVYETMGYNFSNKVLQQASLEIKKCLHENDLIALYGGNKFIVVLENASTDRAGQTAQKIINRFYNQISVENHQIDLNPNIGISIYQKDTSDAKTLMKYADIAMNEAKSQGRNIYLLSEKILSKMRLEDDLKKALQNSEFIVYYQPQIDFKTGIIYGVEA